MFQWKGFLPAFSRTHPNPHFALKVFSNERLQIIVGRFVCLQIIVGRFVYDFIEVNLQGSFVLTPLSPRPPPSPPFLGCNTAVAYSIFILCVTRDILGPFCSATGRMDFFILEEICKIIP